MRAVHSDGRVAETTKRMFKGRTDWPALMYTAVNMRPFLPRESQEALPPPRGFASLPTAATLPVTAAVSRIPLGSEGVMALGYCNVSLPTNDYPIVSRLSRSSREGLSSRAERAWFWDQARSVRAQLTESHSEPSHILARNVLLAKERYERSKAFARLDDERLLGRKPQRTPPQLLPTSQSANITPSAPSVALVGFSLLGNLDPLYPPSAHPSIKLISTHCATRKGPGGLLMYSQTLVGQMGITFSWDREGFEEGVVEGFAEGVVDVLRGVVMNEYDESARSTRNSRAKL